MNETDLITRLKQNINRYEGPPIVGKAKLDKIFKELEMNDFNTNIKTVPVNKNQNSEAKYEMVNHPKHYNNYDVEVVDMMEKIWGTKATMNWCKMTAYKYRMRMGTKPSENDSPEAMKNKLLEDFNKEQWYLSKANELKSKLFDKGIDMNQ